jgi:hypothetical protein
VLFGMSTAWGLTCNYSHTLEARDVARPITPLAEFEGGWALAVGELLAQLVAITAGPWPFVLLLGLICPS